MKRVKVISSGGKFIFLSFLIGLSCPLVIKEVTGKFNIVFPIIGGTILLTFIALAIVEVKQKKKYQNGEGEDITADDNTPAEESSDVKKNGDETGNSPKSLSENS